MNTPGLRDLRAMVLLFAGTSTLWAQEVTPAVPTEPITAVLDAFRTRDIVALGEGNHGNEQGHSFRLSLVRHPRFATTVNDIVVEIGNALYQDVMDRFIGGEDVPYATLRKVWQNTTQPHAGPDRPIYEEFFRAVRAVNASLSKEGHIRVLLGDPPIDWDSPTARQDRDKYINARKSYPAEVVQREVLAKGRRALIIYGDGHLQRRPVHANYQIDDPLAETIVSLLEKAKARVFTIFTATGVNLANLQPNVTSWPAPSLSVMRGTTLGAADFASYFPSGNRRVVIRSGEVMATVPPEQWLVVKMEDQFDAVLYLGAPSTITYSQLSRSLCLDPDYMKMRLGRIELEGPRFLADELRKYCSGVGAPPR
jgi:hypothetical protein